MKSSIDRLNASSAAARMPGKISGKVTFQKVVHSFAPRSIAASSRWRREALHPGADRHDDVADVEHDVGDEDRLTQREQRAAGKRVPRLRAVADEQRQQARPEHDLRGRHRDEDEQVGRPSGPGTRSASAPSAIASRAWSPRASRSSRRSGSPEGVLEAEPPERFAQAASEKSPPDEVEAARWVVEQNSVITAIGSSRYSDREGGERGQAPVEEAARCGSEAGGARGRRRAGRRAAAISRPPR